MKYNFLKISDKTIKDKLVKEGLKLINESNEIYTFLNSDKIQFSEKDIDKSKIQYSNILTF